LTTLVVLVILSVTVISIDQASRTHPVTSGIKSVANDVFSPLRTGVNNILDPIGRFFAGAVDYGPVQQENEHLQHEIGQLRQQLAEQPFARNQQRQLSQLQTQAKLPPMNSLRLETAQTVAMTPSNFAATIEINKGRSAGVTVGMPVVGAGGLVGQVVRTSDSTATVRLVTDGQSKIGVVFGAPSCTTCSGTVAGQGAGKAMVADYIAPLTALQKGEVMFTNGLPGSEYPSGLPVATVSSYHQVSGANQVTVRVEPMANLNQLAYVDVVIWEPTP
jgi:rod shape-determining protein MreC